ncbi:MAG TPA: lytic murein transglycosylase [Thermoleophilaceae bacterium]|nr:lytic murein transglycosylase [Thermoleophilaceae bacterium]
MKTRLLQFLLVAGVLAAAVFTGLAVPASAQQTTVYVKLADGSVVPVTVDVPPGADLGDIQLPGTPVTPPDTPESPVKPPGTQPEAPAQQEPPPSTGGRPQAPSGDEEITRPKRRRPRPERTGGAKAPVVDEVKRKARRRARRTPLRNPDGTPTPDNPGFVDALPGPSMATGVPNFIIRKFRVPVFLLPLYQAAGIQYGIRWEILAAINEIETDYGRNLNVSSAGALGWMQFMPATWRAYGTDANKDGVKDPYNPVDAIFAAARYLKAAGYEQDVRRAIFAYNHADWYVDSVMLRARLIAGVPADLVGSLTGLTEGRFPVHARARYADDLAEQDALRKVRRGENAANVVESDDGRRGIEIFSRRGAPVIAANDGVIKKIGTSKRLGRYLVLQDVYGNRYTYARLGSVARHYPVPKQDALDKKNSAKAISANSDDDPAPTAPASAGRQPDKADSSDKDSAERRDGLQASVPIKQRLFAHPNMPGARQAGGLEQALDAKARKEGGFETYRTYFSRPFGLDSKDVRLRRLKKGARVIGGTILGRVGRTVEGKAAHLYFEIRPAGRGAPRIDPKPILDGWKLLEATAIYRASGRNVLHGDDTDGMSIGQIMLLPKPQLEQRVLADERIDVYDCGRSDIESGQIDRRVLATLAYLAESGLEPTVTSLKCGHSFYTSSGNVSHHSSGNAVDIAMINGIPILGHQEPGGVTEQAVRRLMGLQGTMRASQIISLLDMGANTVAMADHHDHIHVGFQPLFGENRKLGRQAFQVLKPGQWSDLVERLGEIENPIVPTTPSKYSLPAKKKRHSDAHAGE